MNNNDVNLTGNPAKVMSPENENFVVTLKKRLKVNKLNGNNY